MSAHFSQAAATKSDYITVPIIDRLGCLALKEKVFFPPEEYLSLTFDNELPLMSYPDTVNWGMTFASVASANGDLDAVPFGHRRHMKAERAGVWTKNAERCPSIVKWVESVGANFGSVRVLKKCNNIRNLGQLDDAVGLYHRDTNNVYNAVGNGWIVRVMVQLSDNPDSFFMTRVNKNDPLTEQRFSLAAGTQLIVDSDRLWHTAWHPYNTPRYSLLVSFESSTALEAWINRNR